MSDIFIDFIRDFKELIFWLCLDACLADIIVWFLFRLEPFVASGDGPLTLVTVKN